MTPVRPIRCAAGQTGACSPAGRRAWALLSWLALHPGPNARARVAAAFWPDMPDAAARQNLRSAVRVLRQGLTDAGARHLRASRDQLGLDPPEEIRLDLDEFADLAAAGRRAEAVAVARAELLAEFDDDWVQEPRERLRAEVLGLLERLAQDAEADGDPDAALAWTRRQAELAPQAEEPQRRLMTRLARAGDVGKEKEHEHTDDGRTPDAGPDEPARRCVNRS